MGNPAATSTSILATSPVYAPVGSRGSTAVTIDGGILWVSTAHIGHVTVDSGAIFAVNSSSTKEIGAVKTIPNPGSLVYITVPDVSKISTSPGTLLFLSGYTTSTAGTATAVPGVIRLHNTTTSSSTGATVVFSMPIAVIATSTLATLSDLPSSYAHVPLGPWGMPFSEACSVDAVTDSTGTTSLANAKITAIYST